MNKILLPLLLLFCLNFAHSQKYKFVNYKTEDGLAQDFVYSLTQDEKGFLWIGTGEGLSRFDGQKFKNYYIDNGLAEDIVTTSFRYKDQILFGHNEGHVSILKDNKFETLELKSSSAIVSITSQGEELYPIYVLTNKEGVYQVNEDGTNKLGNFGMTRLNSMSIVEDDVLLIGCQEGLIAAVHENGKWDYEDIIIIGEEVVKVQYSKHHDLFFACTKKGKIYTLKYKNEEFIKDELETGNTLFPDVTDVLLDKNGFIWISTYGSGVHKVVLENDNLRVDSYYTVETGLNSNFIKSIYEDAEGNIWLGGFGAGLTRLSNDYFTFYTHSDKVYGNIVSSIYIDTADQWYGLDNGLLRMNKKLDNGWNLYTDSTSFVKDQIKSFYKSDSVLWIGTASNGLHYYDYETDAFYKKELNLTKLENSINCISEYEDNLWIATYGGILIVSTTSIMHSQFNTSSGLGHNSMNFTFHARNDKMYFGGKTRSLYEYTSKGLNEIQLEESGELELTSITDDSQGNLWVGTLSNGLYKIGKEQKIEHFTTKSGLFSNYIYAVTTDDRGQIWIGHRGGLSRINQDHKIHIYDNKDGITGQVMNNAIFIDPYDNIWFGTDDGSIKYDPLKDELNENPPRLNLTKLNISDKAYEKDLKQIELPYGNYRLEFEFIGISYDNSELVQYEYKLEGHDEEFHKLSDVNYATYGKISDGNYRFIVRAYNADGVPGDEVVLSTISVEAPFWKKVWFIILCVVVLSLFVFLLIRLRVRALVVQREYLENELEKKTQEVVQKAEKIEEINKDLTDSINYAERIQSSMLPEVSLLKEALPGSFVFFKPRDIVSGDFYFIKQIKNKLIIACADCTGHGVPGAFISMIGLVTLKNLYKNQSEDNWLAPNKILDLLDVEVTTLLKEDRNYNSKSPENIHKSTDGMDLTLVEIDLDTNKILISSAMRSSLIKKGDQYEVVKGDKHSIGSSGYEKPGFTLQEFQLNKGEQLYLFTDGFPDQFGGDDDKKLKMVGVYSILDQIENSKDRTASLKTAFEEWQGSSMQIDDVLVIGIRF